MMLKNDRWIIEMASGGMIEPFDESLRTEGVISSGVGSYGYDMRLADEFKVYRGGPGDVLDPKASDPEHFEDFKGDICVVPPNSFVLARSLEYFRIPREVLVICFGKSTYARSGVIVNVTPLEPEWEGHVTISIANAGPSAVRLYAREGIAQLLFLGAAEPCRTSYGDRTGKYQAQKGITHSRT
ncbi:MAG: dCTP deaminase [Nitrospirota bacterium]